MKKLFLPIILIVSFIGCNQKSDQHIITSDIQYFWEAFDKISSTQDSVLQYKYLDSLYLRKGTAGLKGIMEARDYTADDFISVINKYPKFWASVRENTFKTKQYSSELTTGIEKMRAIYPVLKPAKIYFTIGALSTSGTTIDSLVLIGSELAMSDKNTVSSEFEGAVQKGRQTYFDNNPINQLVVLTIHEYVHTQQKPALNNLLSYVLREEIAEFVSVKAMNVPSSTPAVQFGKQNPNVMNKFEKEMFYGNNRAQWLWSDSPNEFSTLDLSYYIGYQISELNYDLAEDKLAAIKEMIELDYTNEAQIEDFVDRTGFFSKSIEELYADFDKTRPRVLRINQFENNSTSVDPQTKELTFFFSEPLNGHNTSVDYVPLGEEYFPKLGVNRVWSADNQSWAVNVNVEPNKHYQFYISNNFRTETGTPLKSYLVEFKTRGN
ncbi:MAG: hypothetical protein GW817_12855 [Flavobacteriales bacterium]|nr:hypothetical protein [Flavobacteriales bacterium]NCP84777.1 hypothetical protein [Bacteroidota bacterium]NCQ11706.1 hypothetical protein [Bacteroidota bacterium]NCT16331.1 hypothetical protein [Flavobacteriales bacterium]